MQGMMEQATARAGTLQAELPQRLLRGYLHKTSNSLCGIKGYASLIAAPDRPGTRQAEWAEKILGEIAKMEHIFASVAELTRPREMGDENGDPQAVLRDAVAEAEQAHPDLRIDPERAPEAILLLPAADLRQVLRELLANAAQAAPAPGRPVNVRLAWREDPTGNLVLMVADDGAGIPAGMVEQVKEPFVTTRPGRLGIGLTRVETILEIHRLAWSLTSRPGRGTTVELEAAVPA